MRFMGCSTSVHLTDAAPYVVGRLMLPSEHEATWLRLSLPRLAPMFKAGRIRDVERREYLDRADMPYAYGWTFTRSGLYLAIVPVRAAHLFTMGRMAALCCFRPVFAYIHC
jgi:hypothetical protein